MKILNKLFGIAKTKKSETLPVTTYQSLPSPISIETEENESDEIMTINGSPCIGDIWELIERNQDTPFPKEEKTLRVTITGIKDDWVRFDMKYFKNESMRIDSFTNIYKFHSKGEIKIDKSLQFLDNAEKKIKELIDCNDLNINKQLLKKIYEIEDLIEDAVAKTGAKNEL